MLLNETTNISNELEGDTCYYLRDIKSALCWYNKALVEDPKNIRILIKKGNILVIMHRYTKAYECYIKAFIYGQIYESIDNFVELYNDPPEVEVLKLLYLLNNNYNIPITLDGLNLVLKKVREDRDKYRKVKEWQDFKKYLQQKGKLPLDEYINLFLQRFGESFYKRFVSFYCYISFEKDFHITPNNFASILINQKKKIESENFERFIRTGRKQGSLSHLKGIHFEDYLEKFFDNKGYNVSRTPASYDYGADLIITKFGESTAVQVKGKKEPVGIKAVQEVSAAKEYYKTHKALVVTTSSFTKPAVKLARKLDVELWDRKKLSQQMINPWS